MNRPVTCICGTSKGRPYKHNELSLVLFVCKSAHVTFGGSDWIMRTARPELPYPCIPRHFSGREFSEENVTDGII